MHINKTYVLGSPEANNFVPDKWSGWSIKRFSGCFDNLSKLCFVGWSGRDTRWPARTIRQQHNLWGVYSLTLSSHLLAQVAPTHNNSIIITLTLSPHTNPPLSSMNQEKWGKPKEEEEREEKEELESATTISPSIPKKCSHPLAYGRTTGKKRRQGRRNHLHGLYLKWRQRFSLIPIHLSLDWPPFDHYLFSFAASYGLPVRQMGVKRTFLNGELDDETHGSAQ